ncbi:hypothetical protein QG37_07795 [Candidozyma auris]|uniref:Uncharacterized protein n=1 Tax=Candidozyma auris TaxID=498019 RepID=A0A0L0NP96_CANAR|nr:hypothetical protein QG37_07795 [[Candida] auris]
MKYAKRQQEGHGEYGTRSGTSFFIPVPSANFEAVHAASTPGWAKFASSAALIAKIESQI